MRTKKTILNSLTALLLQIIVIICGFILPKLTLSHFGSEINGAVSSISQFLGYISILEFGVGGVTKAALYKPLTSNDNKQLSGIMNATMNFFRKIAFVFIVYTLILTFSFKFISHSTLDYITTIALVLILSFSTFLEYYFGIGNSLLISADQKSYIINVIRIISVLLNTAISALLISLNCDIIIVKSVSASIFILRPILLSLIVKKIYKLDKYEAPNNECTNQRWNAFGHQIGCFINSNIDNILITVFLGLNWASVYSIYRLIVLSLKQLISSVFGGAEASIGNMIAKNEQDLLNERFKNLETIVSIINVSLYSICGLLLIDFVSLYTKNVSDINYILPLTSTLFVIAYAIQSIKDFYYSLIAISGQYKQTQKIAYTESAINAIISIILINFLQISGVLIGTIISGLYSLLAFSRYVDKTILKRKRYIFFKRNIINVGISTLICFICSFIPFFEINNYWNWVVKAIVISAISIIITSLINIIFYRKDILFISESIKKICKIKK